MARDPFEVPQCLVRSSESLEEVGQPLLMMSCLDAVAMNEQREIFQMEKDYLKLYGNPYLCVGHSLEETENPLIFTSQCSSDFARWEVLSNGQI